MLQDSWSTGKFCYTFVYLYTQIFPDEFDIVRSCQKWVL